MNKIGAIIQSVKALLQPEAQDELIRQLDTSDTIEASLAGAILMEMYMLEYIGFPRYIDEILGEEHMTIDQLKRHYPTRHALATPLKPSTGIILA